MHIKAIKSGCIAWQPNFESKEQEEDAEAKRVLLLNFMNSNSVESLDESTKNFNDSFVLQRFFLNNNKPPTAQEIETTWPCLFNEYYCHLHFVHLTGKLVTDLRSQLNNDVEKILMYGHTTGDNLSDDLKTWKIVSIIFDRFKEDLQSLFTIIQVRI